MTGSAQVVCGDALELLADMSDDLDSIFTSLPDAHEIGLHVGQWRDWFFTAARRTLAATDDDGYALFYQTDRRYAGGIEDKAAILTAAALACNMRPIFHKVAIRTRRADRYRPGYSHFLCYGRTGVGAEVTPDVYDAGHKIYPDATDQATCELGNAFLARQGIRRVFDPFCGRGSILYYAMLDGFDVAGSDIDPQQVAHTVDLLGQPALL